MVRAGVRRRCRHTTTATTSTTTMAARATAGIIAATLPAADAIVRSLDRGGLGVVPLESLRMKRGVVYLPAFETVIPVAVGVAVSTARAGVAINALAW